MANSTNSAYFADLVGLPAVVVAVGFYLTRAGELVHVDAVSARHDFGCTGSYANGAGERWHKSGRLFAGMLSVNDIVAPV